MSLLWKRVLYVVVCTGLGYLLGSLNTGGAIRFAIVGCIAGIVVEVVNGGNLARVLAIVCWVVGTGAGALVGTFDSGSAQAGVTLRWETILGFGAMLLAAIVTRLIVRTGEREKTAEEKAEE